MGDNMSDIIEVMNQYKDVKSSLENLRFENKLQDKIRVNHINNIEKLDLTIEEREQQMELLDKALRVFQKVSDERNAQAKDAIETVINWALSKVFTSQNYKVKIEEDDDARSGKIMEVYLVDIDTGMSRSLNDQTGTALSQILSFLMLLTLIKFAGSSKVLVIDELFSGLEDREMILMFSDILVSLAKNEEFQTFIVEQNSLISANEDFCVVNLALENYEDGLIVKSIKES